MKNLLILLAVVLSGFYSHAQTQASNMMLGGSVSMYSQSFEGSDASFSQFSFSPSFGYFIHDNLAVGASLTIGSSTNDNIGSKTVTSNFGLGPFARYYKFTSNEDFAFFGQAQVLFSTGKQDATPGGEVKTSGLAFALSPGFSYFVTPHWAIDFSVTALSISSFDPDTDSDNNKSTTINVNLSMAPSLGFRYHFGN